MSTRAANRRILVVVLLAAGACERGAALPAGDGGAPAAGGAGGGPGAGGGGQGGGALADAQAAPPRLDATVAPPPDTAAGPPSADARPPQDAPPPPPPPPRDAARPEAAAPPDGAPALPSGPLRIGPLEGVGRLARFLWKQEPDAALRAEAAAGRPSTLAEARQLALRMLDDPRARDVPGDFVVWWLGLERALAVALDARMFPAWSPALAASMIMEARLFAADVVFANDGRLQTLLSAPYTFADPALRPIYGVAGASAGFQRVDLDGNQRAGLLTQGAPLVIGTSASLTSPTKRGVLVRERLLCQMLPPHPPSVPTTPPRNDPGLTRREEYLREIENPACQGCHRLVDPVGFGFETFDALGRFRAAEDGRPVNATGELVSAGDAAGAFSGAIDLVRRLAISDEVRRCFARKWLEHALGRPLASEDEASVDQIVRAGGATGWNIKSVIVETLITPAFFTS
jgi:hypothetical protein